MPFWDVEPALNIQESKTVLSTLSVLCSVGSPRAEVLRATTKKGQFLKKKSVPLQILWPLLERRSNK